MPDFSLVPVDHQPEFSDVSLVPVDHDPFRADDIIQQTRAQLESQPQRLVTGAGSPNVGVPANNVEAAASGESYDPESPTAFPGRASHIIHRQRRYPLLTSSRRSAS